MQEKSLIHLTRVIILIMAICGIVFDLFLVPLTATDVGGEGVPLLVQCIFQWLVSIPCFGILVLAWRVCADMKKGRLFILENSIRIKRAAVSLLVSIIAFLIGKVIFFLLGWNRELILHLIIAIVGFTFLVIMIVLSHYIYRAAELQEESDYTV